MGVVMNVLSKKSLQWYQLRLKFLNYLIYDVFKHKEGYILSKPLKAIRMIMFPLMALKCDGYSWETDTWTIAGQKYSGKFFDSLKNMNAQLKLTNRNGITFIERPEYVANIRGAHQWFKNNDHPADGDPNTEGDVVRYYRNPNVDGKSRCPICGELYHDHGWIDDNPWDYIVHPGEFIVTTNEGKYVPVNPRDFDLLFKQQ